MATRDDHVIMVGYPDGSTIVEHADRTRITVCYKQIQTQSTSSDQAETGKIFWEKYTVKLQIFARDYFFVSLIFTKLAFTFVFIFD